MADLDELPDYYLPKGATGVYEVKTRNGNGSISFAVGDDDVMFSADSSQNTTVDESLALAGLLSSEIERYKNTLLNNNKYDVQNNVVVPIFPTSSPLLSQMKTSNELKLKSYEIEKLKLDADVEYKKTDIQVKLKELELKEKANALKETEIYMQSQVFQQNERIIKQNSTLIKNISSLKNAVIHSSSEVSVSQSKATEKISEGVENQIATNAKIVQKIDKQIEHYDFLKDGKTTLKDSKGNVIKPREVEAKNNAEHHIDKESFNKFDSSVLIDSLDEIDKDFDSDVETIKNLFSSILVLDKDKFKTELNQNIFKVAP